MSGFCFLKSGLEDKLNNFVHILEQIPFSLIHCSYLVNKYPNQIQSSILPCTSQSRGITNKHYTNIPFRHHSNCKLFSSQLSFHPALSERITWWFLYDFSTLLPCGNHGDQLPLPLSLSTSCRIDGWQMPNIVPRLTIFLSLPHVNLYINTAFIHDPI